MTLVIIIDTHKIIWGGCQEERLRKYGKMLMIGNVGGEYMGVYHTNMQFFSMFKVFLKDFKKREIMFL